jgi:cell division septal protein FtsQ
MRRKRKKLRLRWEPIWWILIVANVVAGLTFSPITQIRHVRVDGSADFDQDRLTRVVALMQGVPCSQIRPRRIESAALELPEARSAELNRNLFGSAVLKVRYRRPVARLFDDASTAVAIDGVMYTANSLPQDLPTVQLPETGGSPALTLAGPWQAARIADLAVRAKSLRPQDSINISIGDSGSVWLNMGAGRVGLGSLEDLDTKLRVLKEILDKDPDMLSKVQALNLTAPSHPAVVPKKVGQHP